LKSVKIITKEANWKIENSANLSFNSTFCFYLPKAKAKKAARTIIFILASNTWDWQISHPTFDSHSFLSSLKLCFHHWSVAFCQLRALGSYI
jgi:hypothetical protein